MKIAVVLDHDPRLLNGASRQAGQFVQWLLGRGHQVHLVHTASGMHPPPSGSGLRVSTVPSFPVRSYREYRIPVPPAAARLWLARADVNLVHSETMNPTLLALAYWMKRRAGVPMFNVLTANLPYYTAILLPRDNLARKLVYGLGKPLMNAISNRIEGTFVLSDGMRDSLARRFFAIDPSRLFTWTRPLDPAAYAARREPSDVWGRLGVPRGRRVATLSRLCQSKNVEFLIRAFACHIIPRDPTLHLVVAGEGPNAGQLQRLAAGLGCANIHFPGLIPYDAVPAFLRDTDYFVYASLSETFGNAICEAKYAGVPVVALDDGGGVRSQIADRRTGILVASADEAEFARRFLALLGDEALREAIRREAREDVVLMHSPERVYGNLMRIYQLAAEGALPGRSEIRRILAYPRLVPGATSSL
ncbi:MAG TPA: glycosyltransferase family 4 protein [Vicinamibacterales bacterium]|nr:glycosyltransferase family 4 protein [Vicinamibacterales bacterium]HOQ59644.1 glycosyltransferase family 4 protein [Vicinamibacterales bacterium]